MPAVARLPPSVADLLRRYLDEAAGDEADTIILGCTHFPLLRDVIAEVASAGVELVDSATTTAEVVRATLEKHGLRRKGAAEGKLRLLATDSATRFARVGGQFLGRNLSYRDIEIVDL